MREDIKTRDKTHDVAVTITAGQLLHPSRHFADPCEELAAEDISRGDKRALLASWASDSVKTLDNHNEPSGQRETSGLFDAHGSCRKILGSSPDREVSGCRRSNNREIFYPNSIR